MRSIFVMTALLGWVGLVAAQEAGAAHRQASVQVREDDGGGVAVRTAGGVLNQDSSLKRRWFVMDDLDAPARLERAGVYPRFEEKENMQYLVPVATVAPKQAISAIEVRYLLFDVWGERLRTLAVTRLADSSTHIDVRGTDPWPALEREATNLLTVVGFVAHVRTAEGQVWTFDADRILSQIAALGMSITAADLTPDEQRYFRSGDDVLDVFSGNCAEAEAGGGAAVGASGPEPQALKRRSSKNTACGTSELVPFPSRAGRAL